jgi:salicylate hydroxylase
VARADTSVAIVGGGIGGLTAAVALLQAGFDVHIYEQARWLSEVGAGINVSPNASRVLIRLGLGGDLAKAGVRPSSFHQRRWDNGRTLLRSPLGDAVEAAFGVPHYSFHRADLHALLARAVPAERVHLSHRCVGFDDRGDHVEITFDDGRRASADVLIGADGIHSTIRHRLIGPEQPRFTGCVAYRGLVPADRVAHLDLDASAQIWLGPHQHFVHYFVSAGRLVNFVCLTEQDAWLKESWTDRGEVADVVALYRDWHPQVRAIIAAVDETYKWALFDRVPLARWSVGRVTLLGDACHPMLPFMGQGAAQAIEDAATLAVCLAGFGEQDMPGALARYEQLRLPRASRLQAMSHDNKTRFHLPDGPAQKERDAAMANGATDWSFAAVAWLYEHDAGALETAEIRR